ncbi:hypothetical protein KEM56_002286 [Ascosphaera pollenicola]|nr:hypothetical protein KEM56_002286 [Ascosphaera pollenicola]
MEHWQKFLSGTSLKDGQAPGAGGDEPSSSGSDDDVQLLARQSLTVSPEDETRTRRCSPRDFEVQVPIIDNHDDYTVLSDFFSSDVEDEEEEEEEEDDEDEEEQSGWRESDSDEIVRTTFVYLVPVARLEVEWIANCVVTGTTAKAMDE